MNFSLYDESLQFLLETINASCVANSTNDNFSCPKVFDGYSCIPETSAGLTATFPCPNFIRGFDSKRIAHRYCSENGSWFVNPITNRTWSNYTTCVDFEDLQLRKNVNTVYKFGYVISLCMLVVSLLVFYYLKCLCCTRIQIHKSLFISLAINNCLWLIWYETIVENVPTIIQNGYACQIAHILVHYFMVTTYFWMFCEGLYLHTILVATFMMESRIMTYLNCIGWGIPAALTAIYASLRIYYYEVKFCWMDESIFTLFLSIPVCLSMVANLIFLINIVKTLLSKLPPNVLPTSIEPASTATQQPRRNSKRVSICQQRHTSDMNSKGRIKKAARATLILTPLFGLNFILTPFRPDPTVPWEPFYQYFSAVVTSTQGTCVSVLFCFCNEEVMETLKKKWVRWRIGDGTSWAAWSANFSRSSSVQQQSATAVPNMKIAKPSENETSGVIADEGMSEVGSQRINLNVAPAPLDAVEL